MTVENMLFVLLMLFANLQSGNAVDEFTVGTVDDCKYSQKVFSSDDGSITTFTSNSLYLESCNWTATITTNSKQSIAVNFMSFALGNGDKVQVDDRLFGGTFNQLWMSTNQPNGSYFTLAKSFQVKFSSDSDGQRGLGFTLHWAILDALTTASPLPKNTIFRTVLDQEVSLTSPNYPGNYPPDISMHWILTAPVGTQIYIKFDFFLLSIDDNIKIYTGSDLATEKLVLDQNGYLRDSLPSMVVSESNRVHIIFYSSPYVTAKGFSLTYRIFSPSLLLTTQLYTTTASLPLSDTVKAVIIILVILLVITAAIILGYFFIYKPKRNREQSALIKELHSADVLDSYSIPPRPSTATVRPTSALMNPAFQSNYGSDLRNEAGQDSLKFNEQMRSDQAGMTPYPLLANPWNARGGKLPPLGPLKNNPDDSLATTSSNEVEITKVKKKRKPTKQIEELPPLRSSLAQHRVSKTPQTENTVSQNNHPNAPLGAAEPTVKPSTRPQSAVKPLRQAATGDWEL